MKSLVVILLILGGAYFWLKNSLSSGAFIKAVDEHPTARWAPAVAYYTGSFYRIVGDLPMAATTYWRLVDRIPESSYTERGHYAYLEATDKKSLMSRSELVREYEKFLERYPESRFAPIVQRKVEILRTGGGL